MATLPQTRMSVEEYIQRYIMGGEQPVYEYVDGELVPKGMGTEDHGVVAANLGYLIKSRYRAHFKVAVEVHSRTKETHFRIPDVIVVDRTRPIRGKYPGVDNPCFLCVELKSPDDTLRKLFNKCRDEYHAWGVPYCWVIDPVKLRAWEYFPGDLEPREVFDTISAGPIALHLSEVFEDVEGRSS